MIDLYLTGQKLAVHTPLIVAGSVDYLTIQIHRDDEEWEGLSLHIFFQQEPVTYELLTEGDFIGTDKHLNLTAGEWSVSVVGYDYEDGEMVEKITTNTIGLTVAPAPPDAGESLPDIPPTAYEQIEAIAQSVRDDADAGKFQGEKGDKGETAMTARVGSVTTGMPGTSASVVNSGDDKDLVFDFTIPRGDIGPQGETGPKGDTGEQGPQGEKGDKGDTGNVSSAGDMTVNGVLDIPPLRCNASLSSAGWYRVLTYAGESEAGRRGSPSRIIRLHITRAYVSNNNELHEISLLQNYDSISFADETSKSNVHLIDRIRATYSGNNLYVDLHYNGSSENSVYVDFDVYFNPSTKRLITSSGLTAVAASPSGETVLTEYMFSANGTGDLNVNGAVAGQGFANLLFGIGNSIQSNTNCDSLTSEGKYTCFSSAIAGTLTNPPYTVAFGMLVIRVAEAQRLVQVAIPNNSFITLKLRYYSGTSWTEWKTITPS